MSGGYSKCKIDRTVADTAHACIVSVHGFYDRRLLLNLLIDLHTEFLPTSI